MYVFLNIEQRANSFKIDGAFQRMIQTDEEKFICECESTKQKKNPKENDEF